jgi:hypothetical protein
MFGDAILVSLFPAGDDDNDSISTDSNILLNPADILLNPTEILNKRTKTI